MEVMGLRQVYICTLPYLTLQSSHKTIAAEQDRNKLQRRGLAFTQTSSGPSPLNFSDEQPEMRKPLRNVQQRKVIGENRMVITILSYILLIIYLPESHG
jgi:hypothetical protein